MNAVANPGFDPGAPMTQLPAGWYPDPLDQGFLRFNDGTRWTFWTRTPAPAGRAELDTEQEPPAVEELRADIAAAISQARNIAGAVKELRRLPEKLTAEETVHAAVAGVEAGVGALVVTNHRILFYFEGLLRNQFLHAGFDAIHELDYNTTTKRLEVYTSRRTKRAVPAFSVYVTPRAEAERFLTAARQALSAPRLGFH